MATLPIGGWKPESPAEKGAVHEQLERLLEHTAFRNSRRCASLLRYVVECALDGNGEQLKERSLGMDVFGRNAHYDTNLDPVVRTTASDVRKRIAQYYHEAGHAAEIRIDIPSGSYVPEFHLGNGEAPLPSLVPEVPFMLPSARPRPLETSGHLRLNWRWMGLLAALVLASIALATLRPWESKTGWENFWNPVLATPGSTFISIGEPHLGPRYAVPNDSIMTVGEHTAMGDTVAFSDATAFARIAALLTHAGKTYRASSAGETTLADLRQGSAVLIAGLDNPWTLRLTAPLRYHLVTEGSTSRIADSRNPSQKNWLVDFAIPYSKLTQDYGLVARFLDPNSGQTVIVAAGIGENGTLAAGEFVSDPKYLNQLHVPGGWKGRNVEVVIATQVIDGKSGPPRVEAQYFW